VIPGTAEYELWTIVKRTINGSVKRYVEYFRPFEWGPDQEDCFFVDSGLTYSGAPTTTLSGLAHLEGETVQVLADGAVHPDCPVSSGQITLQRSTTTAHVGLGYTSKLKIMPIEAGSATGTAQGKKKRIGKVTVRLHQTLGCKIGYDDDHLDVIPFRKAGDPMDAPPPLFSGDKEITYPKGWEKDAQPMVVQDQPLPLTVLAMIVPIHTSDGP
jgi:hypothetical protein